MQLFNCVHVWSTEGSVCFMNDEFNPVHTNNVIKYQQCIWFDLYVFVFVCSWLTRDCKPDRAQGQYRH